MLATVIQLYSEESEKFVEDLSESLNSKDDYWCELIYCILAGTQVNNEIVVKSYRSIVETIDWDYNKIDLNTKKYELEISKILKLNGYRFWKGKTKTIVNAAKYFEEIYEALEKNNWEYTRHFMINNVKGIGNKIASHWLRNIGFEIPIIDIHVRRVLACAGCLDKKYSRYQITFKEYILIEKIVIELGRKLGIKPSKLDYMLWKYGRDYCVHNLCEKCVLKRG